jgi:hypothetical protein
MTEQDEEMYMGQDVEGDSDDESAYKGVWFDVMKSLLFLHLLLLGLEFVILLLFLLDSHLQFLVDVCDLVNAFLCFLVSIELKTHLHFFIMLSFSSKRVAWIRPFTQ